MRSSVSEQQNKKAATFGGFCGSELLSNLSLFDIAFEQTKLTFLCDHAVSGIGTTDLVAITETPHRDGRPSVSIPHRATHHQFQVPASRA